MKMGFHFSTSRRGEPGKGTLQSEVHASFRCSRRSLFKRLGLAALTTAMPRTLLAADGSIDYATASARDIWLHHSLYGDPSFDTFKRYPGNPICRGKPPLEWPVNGFLFDDPVSGNWYLYVGNYARGYALGPAIRMVCTIYRSTDRGGHWESLGPIFPSDPFTFEDGVAPASAPDVSVVYDGGRYHMVYDWATDNLTTTTEFHPKDYPKGADVGIAYAWSEHPEGPFKRSPQPIFSCRGQLGEPFLGKYDYFYGGSLVRRKQDWLVLMDMAATEYSAWGLAVTTAQTAQGPWHPPRVLFSVDDDQFQPPLVEYYPAFVHAGWVYAPAYSITANRNFQVVRRAPIEKATDPNAWEMFQHGSVWHAEDVENEAAGIWGQTFTGFVDKNNQFQVMFPSLDPNGLGTINLASRRWDEPYTGAGFCMSGHAGPAISHLRCFYSDFRLEAQLQLRGSLTIFWGFQGPLGVSPKNGPTLHPFSVRPVFGVRLEGAQWTVLAPSKDGESVVVATGRVAENRRRTVVIQRSMEGATEVRLEQETVWRGRLASPQGALGLLVGKDSHLRVKSFSVAGTRQRGTFSSLYTEGLVSAGEQVGKEGWTDWQEMVSPRFRYGVGAVARIPESGRAKWNFAGTGFAVWAPRGPIYGKVEMVVDGKVVGTLDLYDPSDRDSGPVFQMDNLPPGFHAVVLHGSTGRLVIDSIDIHVRT